MKTVAVLTEDGAFAICFRPHPGGFDSSRIPILGVWPRGGGGVLGVGGIDWYINHERNFLLLMNLRLKTTCNTAE